jgi:TonB family protein
MPQTIATEKEPKSVPSSTFTEFNVRQDDGKPHFVRLHDAVVKAMERQLAATTGEAFGILLGSVSSGESCTIAVEEFAPVVNVREAVRARNGVRVVGYYRTQSRTELSVETSDRTLFKKCFPQAPRLALLIKPRTGVATAMFFLGENGLLAATRATVEFPFSLRELGGEDAAPVPAPLASIPVVPGPRIEEPAQGRSLWKIALAWTVGIGVLVGGFGSRVFDRKQTAPVAVERGAAVEPPIVVPAPTPVAPPVGLRKAPVVAPTPKTQYPSVAAPPTPRPLAPDNLPPRVTVPPAPVAQPQPAAAAPPVVEAPVREPIPVPTPVVTAPAVKAPEPVKPYTPPHAVRQLAPVLKENVRRSITGEVPVRLRVYVDATGKVLGVDALNATNPVTGALAAAAVAAVKQWQFEPAQRGDEKVAGEIELSFTFRK